MGTESAVAREQAWLSTIGDSLPSLLASAGGPWQVIASYEQAAATRTQAAAIYITRPRIDQPRVANQRLRPRYAMRLELRWPVKVTNPGATSIAATEQAAFDAAIEQLRQRVAGPLGDKSHGGRFLAAAEAARGQPGITVEYEPATLTIRQAKELRATMCYPVDDYEVND